MGGSDMQENIWVEPHAGKYGSFVKDKVELLLWRKVCVRSGESSLLERVDETCAF
jgi:hypothetical protein